MWFEELQEVAEVFKGNFPLTCLMLIPILIFIAPSQAAHEFEAYRMQHFDLNGRQYGSRSSLINMEARPLSASKVPRRCLIAKLSELSAERYQELVSESAGALVVLIPQNFSAMPQEGLKQWLKVEPQMLELETNMAVYFVREDETLLQIHNDIQQAATGDQAIQRRTLLSAVYANGFQMVATGPQSKQVKDAQIISMEGKLTGKGIEDQLPTIAIVTHYDSFGIAPYLSYGVDSNGSGVAAFMELVRLFSRLYTNSRTHAKYNLLFFLSGGGKFNYQGTKRWIEDNLEVHDMSLLADAEYVICLDSVGGSDSLHLHLSKPPKEGTLPYEILQNFKSAARDLYPSFNFSMVHKKINLADEMLAWEHERFSIRRLPAGTISHLPSHRNIYRTSVADERWRVESSSLTRNVRIMAEGLARQIYSLQNNGVNGAPEIFDNEFGVSEENLEAWVEYLSSNPRPAQLMAKDHPVVVTLEQGLSKYLKDVKRHSFKADKREPEFVFFDGLKSTMHAYNVKPAVFDLFLAGAIASYVGIVYLFLQNFHHVENLIRGLTLKPKGKVH
ncbi:hypothetical protein BSL78_24969 [Apostichopus japonicus]|uniref:Nicalin n=1 Tax=Stichopus japonicus TaxID=307972 RepID=A0A2G8JQZ3_STIJA|nr:hypothetical protein BSL78_24969 [Apostichopus japonicus]